MPTLNPDFEIGGAQGASDAAMRGRAVYAAGFSGPAAHRLILNGATTALFEASLAEAKSLRAIIRIAAPSLTFTGVNPDEGVTDAIRRGIPLATVRADIIYAMAEHDEATSIDTARRLAPSVNAAHTAGVYAQRSAQLDELKAQHG
jgi:hypothetical protein